MDEIDKNKEIGQISSILPEDEYFAKKPAEETAEILNKKANDWFQYLLANNYLIKVKRCWLAYYGAYFDDVNSGHAITFGGEQGEIANLPINHFSNIAQHILVMVTANRPSFQARATNTDSKSLVQTRLANNLLDYYMREKKLEKYLRKAVEMAIVLGSGYVKMEWDSGVGDIVDYDDELNIEIREGDVKFTNLDVFNVVFDSTKENVEELDWVITRTWQNKYDIAAKFPELESKIIQLKTKSDLQQTMMVGKHYDETVDIPVYEFYHKRTAAMPEGRYLMYLDDEIVLVDSPMPYRELPVYRISPADIMGTPYGYTNMFDLLPIQDAVNSLYSVALTNQNAFGVQNVYVPRGADIVLNTLEGGLNIIEGNSQAGKPEPLNLTQTPAEIFNFMQQLEQKMETISGVSSVARGNAEKGVTSGNALALLQSQSLEFSSGLQQQYIRLIEDIGTGLINILRDFASSPKIAAIVGEDNKTEMVEFTGDDLSKVNRVIVEVGNPLANTTAGRVQMAEQMLQMYGDKLSPEQYIAVMNTGRLETLTDGINQTLELIKSENEALVNGKTQVIAIATDQHSSHIKEHQKVLSDPMLRHDADLVQRTLAHIQEHIKLLQETDPNILAMIGEQPLGPPAGSPVSPDNVPGGEMAQQGMGGPQATPMPEAAAQTAPTADTNNMLPSPAQPAQSPTGQPVLPSEKV